VNLIPRSSWGARAPKNRTPLVRKEQRGTAVHYSASNADEQASHTNCAARVKGIQTFHMDGRKWSDIAYSYLVCKHGFVFEGRGLGIRTAAQGTNSGNDAFHAVCFLGDDTANRDDVTDLGRRALRDAILMCNGWADKSEIRPHSFFHPTGCPGDELRSWIIRGIPVLREVILDMDENRLRQIIKEEVTKVFRIATGPDDGSVPASVWFNGVRSDLTEIKTKVADSE
jgi:hypothetical protein